MTPQTLLPTLLERWRHSWDPRISVLIEAAGARVEPVAVVMAATNKQQVQALARAGAELTLLGLQTIELRQDFDGHGDDVLIELEQGLGIVNQYVGVQDVSLFHVLHVVRSPRAGNL